MKLIFNNKTTLVVFVATLLMGLGSCSLVGLDAQEDYEYTSKIIDPNIGISAKAYLESRSYDPKGDSIFNLMRQGLEYAEIDLAEYEAAGRTFVFLHNDAVLRLNKGKPTTDCYFGFYKVNGQPATKWSDYPKEEVKKLLLYLIVQGNHTFETLTPDVTEAITLLPEGSDPLNPKSIMTFNVINDRNSRLTINDFPGTGRSTTARTAGILSINGPIHVVDRVVVYVKI